MLPEEENDPRITGLFDTRLKTPGIKVVTVQPIAYDDELFGNKLPIVSIDIKQEIKEEIIPDDDTHTNNFKPSRTSCITAVFRPKYNSRQIVEHSSNTET